MDRDDRSLDLGSSLLDASVAEGLPVEAKARARKAKHDQREQHSRVKGVRAARVAAEPNLLSQEDRCEGVRARDIMTPVLFSVSPATPTIKVIEQLLALHVKQLFVVDDGGALVGSISALDILRKLEPDTE